MKLKEHQHGTVVWTTATLGVQRSESKFVVHRIEDLDDRVGIVVDFAKALFEIAPETRGLRSHILPGKRYTAFPDLATHIAMQWDLFRGFGIT